MEQVFRIRVAVLLERVVLFIIYVQEITVQAVGVHHEVLAIVSNQFQVYLVPRRLLITVGIQD